MKISIYTPENPLLQEQVISEVIVPSVRGELGILPGHAPLISLLQAGVLRYKTEGASEFQKVAVGWGYLEIEADHVKVLAESVQTKQALDRSKTQKELDQILKQLEQVDLEPSKRQILKNKKQQLESELEL